MIKKIYLSSYFMYLVFALIIWFCYSFFEVSKEPIDEHLKVLFEVINYLSIFSLFSCLLQERSLYCEAGNLLLVGWYLYNIWFDLSYAGYSVIQHAVFVFIDATVIFYLNICILSWLMKISRNA